MVVSEELRLLSLQLASERGQDHLIRRAVASTLAKLSSSISRDSLRKPHLAR